MSRQLLRNIPLYLPLIPLFFVWHITNAYFRLMHFYYPFSYFLITTGATLLLFLLAKWIFKKNNRAAALWTAVIAIPFLFWAPFHDFLRSLPLPGWAYSYSLLLPVYFFLIIGSLIWLRWKKETLHRLTSFLNALFLVLITIEAGVSLFKYFTGQVGNNDTHQRMAKHNMTPSLTLSSDSAAPDIFFIVFDEYASSTSLKKNLGFDNSPLDSQLLQHHFYIADSSKSNYNSTPHSIASTLNLNYLPLELEGAPSDPRHMLEAQYLYRYAKLPGYLSSLKYQVVNLGLMDLDQWPLPGSSFFDRDMDAIYFREMLCGRIYREIWWNFTTRWSWLKFYRRQHEKKLNADIALNEHNYTRVQEELKVQTDQPKLVIAHMMVPHAPFCYDKNGQKRNLEQDLNLSDDSLYLGQLQYINTWISRLASLSDKPFPRPRIVIIEGDHGKRDNKLPMESRPWNKQFMNLNAYYFSDGNYEQLYPGISPVNSFRVLLRQYFNAPLPLLPDSSIMIR